MLFSLNFIPVPIIKTVIQVAYREICIRNIHRYQMHEVGYNYRLTELSSVLGVSQLQKLPKLLKRRQQIAARYSQAFSKNHMLTLPLENPDCQSAWHLYVIKLNLDNLEADRNEIFQALRAENIGVNVHYIPVPWLTYYKKLGYKKGSWPVAESMYHRLVSLPMWPGMKDSDVADVIMAVK